MAEYSGLENISKELIDLLSDEAVNSYDFDKLRKDAINFLRVYEKEQLKINNANNLIAQNKELMKQFPDQASQCLRIIKEQRPIRTFSLREIYKYAFIFEEELNSFLYGDKFPRSGLYVFENPKTHELTTYEISMAEMAQRITYEGKIILSKRMLENFNKETGRLIMEDRQKNENEQYRVEMARAAYIGSSNRLDVYYNKVANHSGESTQKQGGLLGWKTGSRWRFMRVTNAGDMKEAYVSMMFDIHLKKMGIGGAPYYSHELIETYALNYLSKVDNLPAILEEDVISLSDGIQYGIKSKKASMPSLGQYITAAEIVKKAFSDKTVVRKKIAEEIAKTYGQRIPRNIEIELNKFTDESIKQSIKNFKNTFNRTI